MSWETTSGLFEGPATVKDAYFGINPAYNDTALLLFMELEPDDGTKLEKPEQFGVGKGYERSKDGKSVKHESGTDKGFSRASGMGHVVQWATGHPHPNYPGDGADANGLAAEIKKEGGDPVDATIWIGRRFEFAQGPSNPTEKDDEKRAKGSKAWPVKYLGRAEGSKSTGGSKPDAASNGKGSEVDVKALIKRLTKMALTADSVDEFRDDALKFAAGTSLEESVIDGSFYEDANA